MQIEWNNVEISGDANDGDEPLGSKEKFWVTNPDDGRLWLFKFARERDHFVRGEDWAEWIVHHIASALGLPSAEVRPATCEGRRGIVSRSVIDQSLGHRLVHGNSLLAEEDPNYEPTLMRENPRYTVGAVFSALENVLPPSDFEDSGIAPFSAFDVWAGYLLLDALVAGRDRHHENWAVISSLGERSLAPSYDHGNALGFQESDARKQRCLDGPLALYQWAERGRSHHFANRPTLVDLAREALTLTSPDVQQFWHRRVQLLNSERIGSIVQVVPPNVMSDVSRTFVLKLVQINKERLFDVDSGS